jgi:hypothetical protein
MVINFNLILVILSIIVIYYIYYIYYKHCNILEKFKDDKESTLTYYNYGEGYDSGRNGSDKTTLTGKITLRPCQVYFVGKDQHDACDIDYENNSSTCKYEFKDNWKEIDNIINADGSVNTYPKKIYNQDHTEIDITNSIETGQCFKKIDQDSDKRFIYDNNNLVKYNFDGNSNSDTLVINHRTDKSGDYSMGNFISMKFNNDADTLTNYNNIVNSICSKKNNTINSLYNITTNSNNPYFYKFGLDENNNIKIISDNGKHVPSIKLVELNTEQNRFIEHDMSNFTTQSLIGIDFYSLQNNTLHFNVFKDISLSDIDCIVYRFNYDYLCNNNIHSYINPLNAKLLLKSFMDVETGVINAKKKWSIPNDPTILTSTFWNQFSQRNPRVSQKDIIIRILNTEKTIKITELETTSTHNTVIRKLQEKLSWYKSKKTFYENERDEISNLSFTEIMDIKKNNYEDENGIITYNRHIKPYNYKKGYSIKIDRPESSYGTRTTYGSIPPINNKNLKYKNENSIVFGAVGLYGLKYNGYLNNNGSWTSATHEGGASIKSKNVTNFDNIYTMGDGKSERYTWSWKGHFYAHVSGYYYFYTDSDDASFVYLNGSIVVNNGGPHGMRSITSQRIWLNAGDIRAIEITFGERTGGDNMHFRWKYNNYGWISNARHNNKNWFYNSINIDDSEKTQNLNWIFRNGGYEASFTSNENIDIDSIKLDNKLIRKDTLHTYSQTEWVPIELLNGNNQNYDFYVKGDLNRTIQFRAVDKIGTLRRKTNYIVTGNEVYDSTSSSGFNDVLNEKSVWWNNNNVARQHSITINAYETVETTVTSFIFLQKGFYKFNADLGFPESITIKQCRITIDDTIINTDTEYRYNSGGFHMMSFSCYALNNSSSNINANFRFIVDFRSSVSTMERTNEEMNNYLYAGTNLYNDYKSNFNNQFQNINIFETNTASNFNEIKGVLNNKNGRGKDFWNLSHIDSNIITLTESISSRKLQLEEAITDINSRYNDMIQKFTDLDYESEFINNTNYFDKVTVNYKSNVHISKIVRTDIDITSYITNEKISDITMRTPKDLLDTSFNYLDKTEKSLYILKESIQLPPSPDPPIIN